MIEFTGIIIMGTYTILVGWIVTLNGNMEIPVEVRNDMYRVLI